MYLTIVLFLAAGAPTKSCPLDRLNLGPSTLSWGAFTVGAEHPEVESALGAALDLRSDEESESRYADVRVGERPVVLHFGDVEGAWTLTGLTILAAKEDRADCWTRGALIERVREVAPMARYLRSRHEPDLAEADNDFPMYSLDEGNVRVVLLKLPRREIYVGDLDRLD